MTLYECKDCGRIEYHDFEECPFCGSEDIAERDDECPETYYAEENQ